MARRTSPDERTVTPSGFRRITLAVLVTQVAIVLTGAAVRLTGSGLGCSDWPRCEQDQLVPSGEYHAVIEFVNRAMSLPVLVAVVVAIWAAGRRVPFRRDLRDLSLVLLGGVVAQVLLGAVVVRLELLPSTVIVHFLVSMGLLYVAVTLHHRAADDAAAVETIADREPPTDEPAADEAGTVSPGWVPAWSHRLVVALVAGAGAVVVTGTIVTAAGPHGGDDRAARLDIFLPTAARIHSATVWAFLAMLVATLLVLRAERAPGAVRAAGTTVLALSLAQGTVGYLQYWNDVPALLVFLHIIGAMAVWASTVWFWLEHRRVAAGDLAAAPRGPVAVGRGA